MNIQDLNCELVMENAPFRASKVLKIMDSISSVSKSALISSWNKARGFQPTEKTLDVDEDENELIDLELLKSNSLMNSQLKYKMTKMSLFQQKKLKKNSIKPA